MARDQVIGVDAATGSVLAGVFDLLGRILDHASQDISVWKPAALVVGQPSEGICTAAFHRVTYGIFRSMYRDLKRHQSLAAHS